MTEVKMTPAMQLAKGLPFAEGIFILALITGFVLKYFAVDNAVTTVALSGLAITYFFKAYTPPANIEPKKSSEEQAGFSELLVTIIIPKVLYISSSVLVLGILFYLNGNPGKMQILLIGTTTAIAGIVVGLLMGITRWYFSVLVPVFARSVPLLFVGICILNEWI